MKYTSVLFLVSIFFSTHLGDMVGTDPFPPEAPKNLRQGNFTVGHDGSLSIIINWDAPPKGNLEIHHYKIYWSLRVPRKPMMAARKDNWKMRRVHVILLHVLPRIPSRVMSPRVHRWQSF
ncbi:hypothetical protein KIL84_022487 [Mauremys mutica]|uniref:Fibronectin type-III domain-containing protein n=1 Tax=Mauremys mutica TaxID=74926 RepID=A0A9D3WQV5_9SAUR|nr:hypothetical protein KIL84_022487 [Mauremys mutica]